MKVIGMTILDHTITFFMHTTFLKRGILFTFSFFVSVYSFAQPAPISKEDDDLPKDYLTKDFHAGRRAALRQAMPANSVVAVFAFPTRTFSNDVDYIYHANPDLYYFSGYKEPHSVLLVFKDEQTDSAGNKYSELLFVQKRSPQAEQWTGKRLGTEGAKEKLGIRMSFNGEDFNNFPVDFTKFDKIIFDRFPTDIPDERDRQICLTWSVNSNKKQQCRKTIQKIPALTIALTVI